MCDKFSITQVQSVPGHFMTTIAKRFAKRIANYFITSVNIKDLTKAGTNKYFKEVLIKLEEVNIIFIYFLAKLDKNRARLIFYNHKYI